MTTALLLALLGGLLLNLMPCVLPVLAIKAVSLASAGPAAARAHALAYTAGVLVFVLSLASLLLLFRAGGVAVGWGFQLQSPWVVAVLAAILFTAALHLAGWIQLRWPAANLGAGLAKRAGWIGAFFTGALSVIVASPCTGPFMAGALGFALVQPPGAALAVFAALGLGLAAPVLLIALWPPLGARLPRPGPWMVRLRKGMSVPMFASAAWLGWVLLHLLRPAASMPITTADLTWEPFNPARAAALQAEGRRVFIDFTADWCLICKANERGVLASDGVHSLFANGDVVLMRADWTLQDPVITRELQARGRPGVPLYLVIDPRGEQILPQVLTLPAIRAALERG